MRRVLRQTGRPDAAQRHTDSARGFERAVDAFAGLTFAAMGGERVVPGASHQAGAGPDATPRGEQPDVEST